MKYDICLVYKCIQKNTYFWYTIITSLYNNQLYAIKYYVFLAYNCYYIQIIYNKILLFSNVIVQNIIKYKLKMKYIFLYKCISEILHNLRIQLYMPITTIILVIAAFLAITLIETDLHFYCLLWQRVTAFASKHEKLISAYFRKYASILYISENKQCAYSSHDIEQA